MSSVKRMSAFVAVLAAMALAPPAVADPSTLLRVDFSNPAAMPSHWTLTIYPDGHGHFRSERGSSPTADQQAMETPDVDRDVKLSADFADRVFQHVRGRQFQNGNCESHMKVAFQGWKKLTYTGPEGEWTCEFNYSREKQVQELGDSLLAVASTIQEGVRLEMLLQHDRLGLDKELEFIDEGAADGRLLQLCTIRDILMRLSNDDEVMERVRKRARTRLAKMDK
jgi:hypothetical protein